MKLVSPAELNALLASGLDIVDVREPSEWQTGHIPGARLMPLGRVLADPRQALPRDGVVLVCARGGRSRQAAELADGLGYQQVASLDGGTEAWRAAGLPLDGVAAPPGTAPQADAPPDPTLDSVVGQNLRRERTLRGWSLDDLAREAGIARTLLGQIELGKATPSISVVWKIAQAIGVPFAALLAHATPRIGTVVVRRADAKRLASADGRFTSRALYPLGDMQAPEFYELWLAPHSREDAEAHRPGTCENLVVTAGQLELHIGAEVVHLAKGDAVNFSADLPHSYVNPSGQECWAYLVMRYSGSAAVR